MDIERPDIKRRKKRNQRALVVGVVLVIALITAGLSQLSPAAPKVDRNQVWIDPVKFGEMLRQVRGPGTLVPEQIQYVQAESEGRIERIFELPGAAVEPETLIMELSNPDLEQEAFDLEGQLKANAARMTQLKVQLETDSLTLEASIAALESDSIQATLEAEVDTALAEQGLIPVLTRKKSQARSTQLQSQLELAKRRLSIKAQADEAQLAVLQAEEANLLATLSLKNHRVQALKVRAGVAGVLQRIGDVRDLQVGQRVSSGSTLALIVQPDRLKAVVRIPETQARDVQIGQLAQIDTRNGIASGTVSRVDPAVENGTVTVDVRFTSPLPRGARPDLSIDGTIELERLSEVIHLLRPVHAQAHSTIGLFKIFPNGDALRIPVKVGRVSVNAVEILDGLQPGDEVILSDMSQWDSYPRLRVH